MKPVLLQAGTAVADITPPLEVGLLTSAVQGLYAPFESVRLPLKARVLVWQWGDVRLALVALDLLNLNDTAVGGWADFKKELSGDIPPEHIIITCTHTHTAPESVALSNLYLTTAFRQWWAQVRQRVKLAIEQACAALRPCNLLVSAAVTEGLSLQRRIPTPAGIVMSDALQPVTQAMLAREPVDRRVRLLRMEDTDGVAIATVVHAVCHPVYEMCMPHVSPDFPGEMCLALEEAGSDGMPLFLNGAAGDANPPAVSGGSQQARRHGQALAGLVKNNRQWKRITGTGLFFAHRRLQLNIRQGSGMTNTADAMARISVVCMGSLAIVFLPGEPFVETAFDIEKNAPFENTIVVGYSENNIGYLPTSRALQEGGYEAGPGKWSFVQEQAEAIIRSEAIGLLEKIYHEQKRKQEI